MGGRYVIDEFAGPLAKRLAAIDVERTYRQAIEIAADEGVEMLRMELEAEGAPSNIARSIHTLRLQGLQGGAGIRDSDPASDDALEWELGAMDGSTPPHGTFHFVSEDMADVASEEAAARFTNQIVGLQ